MSGVRHAGRGEGAELSGGYRKVKTRMWLDDKVRPLNVYAKLVFSYLMTTHHSHLSGVYFIHPQTVARELNIRETDVRAAFATLEAVGRLVYDGEAEAVFVVNMFRHQAGPAGGGPKMLRCAAVQLEHVGSAKLAGAFLARYAGLGVPYDGPSIPYRYPIDRVSVYVDEDVDEDVYEGLPPRSTDTVSELETTAPPPSRAHRRTGARAVLETRRQDALRLFQAQEELRCDAVPGTRKRTATDERLTAIAERLEAGATVGDCEHVLRVYAHEARLATGKGDRVWFDGETNWRPKNFERALGQPDPSRVNGTINLSRRAEEDMQRMRELYGTSASDGS